MDTPSPERELMRLTIGYWASQAVYVAAKLGLADHLADGPRTVTDLAERTGTHPPSLARLLRFLAEIGILWRGAADMFGLTATGRLLRRADHGSMRDLAILYGEEFYAGWGNLLHTVTTGENAFQAVHGAAMYPYFGQSPELTAKFDRAMAAGSVFFEEIPKSYDFDGPQTVVDVAGGNGALLVEILTANPKASGVLFDTPHVVAAAREALAGSPVAERLEFADGDYYRAVPPDGDLYLLSRVLHGRDDDRCRLVLERIRAAAPDRGRVLIIERVIPEDGARSLAVWFDLHMLAVAGGWERTTSAYRRLLADTGFELVGSHPLPLDTTLLVAAPRW